ncbi:MAG: hypothetical protein AABX47_01200 [Nanoarchaeota archaeon]
MFGNVSRGRFDPDRKTTIRCIYDPKKTILRVIVRDQGDGFDWHKLVDAEKDARGTKKHFNFYRDQHDRHQGSRGYGLFELIRYCSVR